MEKQYAFAKHGNLVFITNSVPRFRVKPKAISRFAHGVLEKLEFKHTAISFVFVSEAKIKRLNQQYLGHDWVTDVLAFPYGDAFKVNQVDRGRSFLGEVVISPIQARHYSRKFGLSFQEEFARYICHGILHLNGYSDRSIRARAFMEKAENKLLKTFASKVKRLI